jgi:hypothetical protein
MDDAETTGRRQANLMLAWVQWLGFVVIVPPMLLSLARGPWYQTAIWFVVSAWMIAVIVLLRFCRDLVKGEMKP